MRRFLLVATAALLVATIPAGAGAQSAVPANASLAPGTYAGTALKGFTARDAQPLYTEALKQACADAAAVDAQLAKGPAAGNGVLLGSSEGRIVASESIHVFSNSKAAKKFVTTARSSPGCLAYAARDSMNRVFVQYPSLPPLPTFAPEATRDGSTVSATFEGTSPPTPLMGSTALVTWGNLVAEAAIRIAVANPGELDSLSRSLYGSIAYDGRSATGAATNPKLSRQADALAQEFLAQATSKTGFAFQPATRFGVPTDPESCAAATDAYVYSGVHGAVRGFAGQDAGTTVAARPEVIVFRDSAGSDRYLSSYSKLATCFRELYTRGLPPGSTVTVDRVPKRGTAAVPGGTDAKRVLYRSTLVGPDGAQIGKIAVVVMGSGNRAAYVLAQLASSDPSINITDRISDLERAVGTVLSQK